MTEMNTKSTKYLMYMHAGSANHGCEAIVRGLSCILGNGADISVISNRPEQDEQAELDKLVRIIPARPHDSGFLRKAWFYLLRHLTGSSDARMKYKYAGAEPFAEYEAAFSIGGDNYCYPDALSDLAGANLMFNRSGIPTALIGCSVEPDILKEPGIVTDLGRYGLIVARESVTYKALLDALPRDRHERIRLLPDPAFALEPKECELPAGFRIGHTIGVNVSPMIINYEAGEKSGITMENYRFLIETILRETGDTVALIPHVVTPLSDDRKPLKQLYDMFADSGRVILAEDRPAGELKYMISKCRLLIAARTHASIAAYSSCVPTLVVGYSVKACGIAKDLFGTDEGYVCPVQSLRNKDDLTAAYTRLEAEAETQRELLQDRIPEWKNRCRELKDILQSGIFR